MDAMDTTPSPKPMRHPWRDSGRRCITCRWVEVKLCGGASRAVWGEAWPPPGLGCTNPKCCYGTAKRDGACCCWEREPGIEG